MKNNLLDGACFIIAEAGVNHNGDLDLAKKLVDAAVAAGVDAIKFQTFKAEELVTRAAPKANYQKATTGEGNQYAMLKQLELSLEDHIILKNYCQEQGIIFLSTPFDFASADLLERLDLPFYKISSGDITNLPFLEYIAKKNRPVLLSTGMSNLGEVEAAVETMLGTGNQDLILLHCTSNYPTVFTDVNLRAMLTLQEAFKLPVGYSDHTLGIEVPIAAVALGARVIEKHFTLDRTMPGPDHRASLEPHELKAMVEKIRNVEKAMGDGIKKCVRSEENTRLVARKSIVASRDIFAGEEITVNDLSFKRPGNGLKPEYINYLLGKRANRLIKKDQIITFDDLK